MRLTADNRFYVYVYLDPRKPGDYNYGEYHFDYEPFYVGKGSNERAYEHLTNFELSLKRAKSNKFKCAKIRKILSFKSKPIVQIKFKNLFEQESFKLEINMINIIGRKDKNRGPLCNFTNGGEGCSGRIVSNETKETQRQKMTGFKHSKETRAKMSKKHSGCKNANYGKKGYWSGKKLPIEMINKMKQKKVSPEIIEKIKKTQRDNSKIKIDVVGKITIKNISVSEASEKTNISYPSIYNGLKKSKNGMYFKNDYTFIIVSGNFMVSGKANSFNDL